MVTRINSGLSDSDNQLWKNYECKGDFDSRTKLIESYIPLARRISTKLYGKRHDDTISFEDYLQLGIVGLIESIDRYDRSQEVLFENYAVHRINGAILTGIQKYSDKNEQVAFKARLRRERVDSLVSGQKKRKNDIFLEMAELTIGMAISYMLDGASMMISDSKKADDLVYKNSNTIQLREKILKVVDILPDKEQLVIKYHYYYDIEFSKIAVLMGVTKGRVSQIHKQALKIIREKSPVSDELDKYM